MDTATKASPETQLEIIAAIEHDDRSALYALLDEHGLNCYLKREWVTDDDEDAMEERCFHECAGNAANIAVRFKNESLAVELVQRGIEVVDTYYSAESSMGWSEESNTLFENALYYAMPHLARELMSRSPGVDWGRENRHDCDGWSAGRWSNSLFLKVLQSTQAQDILLQAGILAGTLAEHLVNISAENGQFRIRIGEEDLGLQPSLTGAMRFVADKVGYTLFDHEAAAEGYDGHVEASLAAMDADENLAESETVPVTGQSTSPNYSDTTEDIPF